MQNLMSLTKRCFLFLKINQKFQFGEDSIRRYMKVNPDKIPTLPGCFRLWLV